MVRNLDECKARAKRYSGDTQPLLAVISQTQELRQAWKAGPRRSRRVHARKTELRFGACWLLYGRDKYTGAHSRRQRERRGPQAVRAQEPAGRVFLAEVGRSAERGRHQSEIRRRESGGVERLTVAATIDTSASLRVARFCKLRLQRIQRFQRVARRHLVGVQCLQRFDQLFRGARWRWFGGGARGHREQRQVVDQGACGLSAILRLEF